MPTRFLAAAQAAAAAAVPAVYHVPETENLATDMSERYSSAAIHLAGMIHVSTTLLHDHGLALGIDVQDMINLQRDCARAWMYERGMDAEEFDGAFEALIRAAKTTRYLEQMPA